MRKMGKHSWTIFLNRNDLSPINLTSSGPISHYFGTLSYNNPGTVSIHLVITALFVKQELFANDVE